MIRVMSRGTEAGSARQHAPARWGAFGAALCALALALSAAVAALPGVGQAQAAEERATPSYGTAALNDRNISVYAGGNLNMKLFESEGTLVVGGDLLNNAEHSTAGEVVWGMGLSPVGGADFVNVGGSVNRTITPNEQVSVGSTVRVGGSVTPANQFRFIDKNSPEATMEDTNTGYDKAGTLIQGVGKTDALKVRQADGSVTDYNNFTDQVLRPLSADLAAKQTTGTVELQGADKTPSVTDYITEVDPWDGTKYRNKLDSITHEGRIVFTGDGSSKLQVFELDVQAAEAFRQAGDAKGAYSGMSLDFENIPDDANIVINVKNSGNVTLQPGFRTWVNGTETSIPVNARPSNGWGDKFYGFQSITSRVMWNWANASVVNIHRGAGAALDNPVHTDESGYMSHYKMFPGSTLVPNGDYLVGSYDAANNSYDWGTETNGRIFASGNVLLSGSEHHNAAWNGSTYTDRGFTPAVLPLMAKKAWDAGTSDKPITDFAFELYNNENATGNPVQTVHASADGTVAFSQLTFDEKFFDDGADLPEGQTSESKQVTYSVKEVVPADTEGITYDTKVAQVPITVTKTLRTDANTGLQTVETTAETTASPDASGNQNLTFNNSYRPTPASVQMPAVYKYLTGRDMKAGEFSFDLKDAAGTVVQTAQNDEKGTIAFKDLTFDKAGTYTYTITEQNAGKTIDGTEYTDQMVNVKIVVSEDKQAHALKAEVTYGMGFASDDAAPRGPMTFINTYTATPTSAQLHATKTVNGAAPGDDFAGKFTFTLHRHSAPAGAAAFDDVTETVPADGAVAFPEVTYDKAGTYTYTITEAAGSAPGVTYDAAEHTATVTVTDDGVGHLSASVDYDGRGADAVPAFDNAYAPAPAADALSATKAVRASAGNSYEMAGGEFSFTLHRDAAPAGAAPFADVTAANGADGSVDLGEVPFDAPGSYSFTVSEGDVDAAAHPGFSKDPAAYTVSYEVTDEGRDGQLDVASKTVEKAGAPADALAFVNAYAPSAATAQLQATKTVNGQAPGNDFANKFSFQPLEDGVQIGSDVPAGADGAVTFPAITYDRPGTHTYTIREAAGSVPGVTYDAAEHTATVTVTDDGNGALEATVAYDGGKAPAFDNAYAPAPASDALSATKAVRASAGNSYEMAGGEFSFTLHRDAAPAGAAPFADVTAANAADGSVDLGEVSFDAPGSYSFTVSEGDVDAAAHPGFSKDPAAYTVSYEVTDEGRDGQLDVASKTVTKTGAGAADAIAFTNAYSPSEASYGIGGKKVIENTDAATNRIPASGEFTFMLSAHDGAPMPAGSSNGAKTVTNTGSAFSFGAATYTKPGTYVYTVTEVAGNDPTITYDAHKETVTVTVTDNGGKLTAVANTQASDLVFTNSYTPTPTTAAFDGTKSLAGKDLSAGDFSFVLKDSAGKVLQTVQNDADGSFAFEPLAFTAVGTYTYTVAENLGGSTVDGIAYDGTVYTATVTVSEDAAAHALQAKTTLSKTPAATPSAGTSANDAKATTGKNPVAADAIAFANTYTAEPAAITLHATKQLKGADLSQGRFSFQLKDEKGTVLQTVKNAADGSVRFDELTYDKPGTYSYSIAEVNDGQDNVTYDGQPERAVTVAVVDDLKGHLVATAASDGTQNGAPTFVNTYTPPQNPPTSTTDKPKGEGNGDKPATGSSTQQKAQQSGLAKTGDMPLAPLAAIGAIALAAAGAAALARKRH